MHGVLLSIAQLMLIARGEGKAARIKKMQALLSL